MKIYRWLVGEQIFSGRSRYGRRDRRGKSNWFLSHCPSLRMPAFPPTAPTLLSVIMWRARLPANLDHLDSPVILSADRLWRLLRLAFFFFPSHFETLTSTSHLSLTWGTFKVIPPDNLLMLVRLIDESIAEAPQACSRIRPTESHASADQYWHLLEYRGT